MHDRDHGGVIGGDGEGGDSSHDDSLNLNRRLIDGEAYR